MPAATPMLAALVDTADTGGVVAPLTVIAACVVISVVAVVVGRRRDRPAGDHRYATGRSGDDWGAGHDDLLAWQSSHGHHVDRWLDAHEGTLPDLVPGADPAIDAELDRAMADAAGVCPNPEVSAMLIGMRDTARATRTAITGGDREGATEAHSAYSRHRSDAIARMSGTPRRAGSPDAAHR